MIFGGGIHTELITPDFPEVTKEISPRGPCVHHVRVVDSSLDHVSLAQMNDRCYHPSKDLSSRLRTGRC